jgi:hypothetical protein
VKQFRFVIVDDRGGQDGYERFIAQLKHRKYLREAETRLSLDPATLGWNVDDQPMRFRILTSDIHRSGLGFSFCKALDVFDREKELFDFFVFDLAFVHGAMDPTNCHEECAEARLYQNPELQVTEASAGEKSRYLGGLSFLLRTELDSRPKLICSAAAQTEVFRQSLNLLSDRLRDIFFVEPDVSSYADRTTAAPTTERAFAALDRYLRSRQVRVVSRLSSAVRTAVVSRLTTGAELDTPDIVELGEEAGEGWSLRTLFPRECRLIEEEGDEAAKNTVLELLTGRRDWPALIGNGGLLDHPNPAKIDVAEHFEAARNLDFGVDVGKPYRPLTKLRSRGVLFEPGRQAMLADLVVLAGAAAGGQEWREPDCLVQFLPSSDRPVSIADYFGSLGLTRPYVSLKSWCKNFGLYPMDIAYVSHIAHHNDRHSDSRGVRFSVARNQTLRFEWLYELPAASDVFDDESRLVHRIVDAARRPQILGDEGFGDIARIVCWRYRGTLEFASEMRLVTVKIDTWQRPEINLCSGDCVKGARLRITIPGVEEQG